MSTNIVLKFDKEMTDPSGKHGEFSAEANGTTALTLTAIALDTDTTKYNLTVSETVLSTDTVTVSYTKGTVTNAYGVSLESFTDYNVRNTIASTIQSASVINDGGTGLITMVFDEDMANPSGKEAEFSVAKGGGLQQEWDNYPDTPIEIFYSGAWHQTVDLPYQMIYEDFTFGLTRLLMSDTPIYMVDVVNRYGVDNTSSAITFITLSSGAWGTTVSTATSSNCIITGPFELNEDVYTSADYLTVRFTKTTTDAISLTITDIYLDANIKQIKMTLAEEILNTDAITIGYTQGTIQSASGGVLNEFSDFSVTNNV